MKNSCSLIQMIFCGATFYSKYRQKKKKSIFLSELLLIFSFPLVFFLFKFSFVLYVYHLIFWYRSYLSHPLFLFYFLFSEFIFCFSRNNFAFRSFLLIDFFSLFANILIFWKTWLYQRKIHTHLLTLNLSAMHCVAKLCIETFQF